jgi:pimeloyl-ACP methyl ester carboxylesterase
MMRTFVLVHGGWRGGWTFAPIARTLRGLGHEVFTPTLTGLGERAHLACARPNLDTHITDVANVLAYEDLTDVILCGHSYAGMVLSGVADRMPERIAALVYVDAFVPDDGDAWWDLAGDDFRKVAIDGSAADGFGVAPPPPDSDPRRVPHPLAAFRQSIRLTGRWQQVPEKMFIYATGWEGTPFTPTFERLRHDRGWQVKALPTGHNVIGEAPGAFLACIQNLRSVRPDPAPRASAEAETT